jgi:hypothetical protein
MCSWFPNRLYLLRQGIELEWTRDQGVFSTRQDTSRGRKPSQMKVPHLIASLPGSQPPHETLQAVSR